MPAAIHPDYPITLTELEARNGFEVVKIANPYAAEPGAKPLLFAAVRYSDDCNRLLKMRGPDGRIGYIHRATDPPAAPVPPEKRAWRSVSQPVTSLPEALATIGAALRPC